MKLPGKLKSVVFLLIKLGVTALAFYLISRRIEFGRLAHFHIQNVKLLLVALAGANVLVFLQAARWHFVLKTSSITSTIRQDVLSVWFGHLLNNFLPTSAAGDLVRGFVLRYRGGDQGKWVGALVAEKYSAVLTALALAILVATSTEMVGMPTQIKFIVAAVFACAIVSIFVLYLIIFIGRSFLSERILSYFVEIYRGIKNTFLTASGRNILVSSFMINIGMCLIFIANAHALGISLDTSYCFFIVPVFTILAALPISYGGWGVRELTSVQLLGLVNIDGDQALAISMLYGFTILLSSLPGAFAIGRFVKSTKEARAAYKLANNGNSLKF